MFFRDRCYAIDGGGVGWGCCCTCIAGVGWGAVGPTVILVAPAHMVDATPFSIS